MGGPTMLRAAAKNFRARGGGGGPRGLHAARSSSSTGRAGIDAPTRLYFAQKAFRHTARYEAAIAGYFAQVEAKDGGFAVAESEDVFPYRLGLSFEKVQDLRYGENPHQRARLLQRPRLHALLGGRGPQGAGQGALVQQHPRPRRGLAARHGAATSPACVIVKHTNPCGTGLGATTLEAYERAWACDPVSAFGGIVAFNRRLEHAAAAEDRLRVRGGGDRPRLSTPTPSEALAGKKNLRVMDMDTTGIHKVTGFDLRRVMGGLLAQEWDLHQLDRAKCEVVTKRKPTDEEWKAMELAWTVAKHVKSQRHRLRERRADGGRGRGPDEPRGRRAHRRAEGAAPAARAPPRPPTRSSRSATASTRWRRRARPRSSSPAARSRTRRSSPPPTSTAWRWSSRGCATSSTESSGRSQGA